MARHWQTPTERANNPRDAVRAEMGYLKRLAFSRAVCFGDGMDYRGQEINTSIDRLRENLRYLVYGTAGTPERLEAVVAKLEHLEHFMDLRPGRHAKMIALQVRAIIWDLYMGQATLH